MHSTSDQFHYRRVKFSFQLMSKIGNILTKVETLRITLNIDGVWCSVYIRVTTSHSPITLVNIWSINLVSILRCSSPPCNVVYMRRVDPSSLTLVFHHTDTHLSLELHVCRGSLRNKTVDHRRVLSSALGTSGGGDATGSAVWITGVFINSGGKHGYTICTCIIP